MSEKSDAQAKSGGRMHAVVRGRVQGVNYRYYAVQSARRLGVRGWVANRWDGTVEVVAEGSRADLVRFVDALRRGSPRSYVDDVQVAWEPTPTGEFDAFYVRYS